MVGDFPDVDVPKIQGSVVDLELDGTRGTDGFVPLPVVLHDHLIHHPYSVEVDRHPLPPSLS